MEQIVCAVADQEKISKSEFAVSPGCSTGDFYLGFVDAVEIKGKGEDGKEKILKVIVKTAPKSDAFRNNYPVKGAFDREAYFYETIYPVLQKFQSERGIKAPFNQVPKAYWTSVADKEEVVVLENLKLQNFSMWDRKNLMDDIHVKAILKTYARLHAISFAFKDQKEEQFKQLTENLTDLYEKQVDNGSETIGDNLSKIIQAFDELEDQAVVDRLTKHKESLKEDLADVQNYKGQYGVLLHGDCWCNNFLFKYEDKEAPKTPTDLRLLDFQIIKMGSPAIDLAHFLFCCAENKIIEDHQTYLSFYYDQLCENIKQHGSDPSKVYPREAFTNEWKKYSRYGLNIATIIMKLMLSEADEVPDMKAAGDKGLTLSTIFIYTCRKEAEYMERMKFIVNHLVKESYL